MSNNSIGMRRHTQQQHRPRGSGRDFPSGTLSDGWLEAGSKHLSSSRAVL